MNIHTVFKKNLFWLLALIRIHSGSYVNKMKTSITYMGKAPVSYFILFNISHNKLYIFSTELMLTCSLGE